MTEFDYTKLLRYKHEATHTGIVGCGHGSKEGELLPDVETHALGRCPERFGRWAKFPHEHYSCPNCKQEWIRPIKVEGEQMLKPLSVKFWRQVARERKLIRRCKNRGHLGVAILRRYKDNPTEVVYLMECVRCGDRWTVTQ